MATREEDERVSMSRQLLFIVAILASSFLIFLVQPMVGKRILPWFGGTPSVWTLCLAFYQTTLFFGYVYAHLLIRFASPMAQFSIHAVVVCMAFIVLPILPGESWQSGDVTNPNSDILSMLASSVALPFMALASTGPLVQAWFARFYPGRSPYPLYAVSNVGSFAALLMYPFIFEPNLPLSTTGTLWSYAFATTAAAVLGCAFVARNSQFKTETAGSADSRDGVEPPKTLHVALWVLLAGCAVIFLMGVTNSLCLDIASGPFLWVLPLATYLLTFIISFASERNYHRVGYAIFTLIAAFLTVGESYTAEFVRAVFSQEISRAYFRFVVRMYFQVPAYCALLFGGCMIMHGELFRLRPPPRLLTGFYLCVSGGGALGGLFVGLLAPVLFDGFYEIRVGLGLVVLLFFAVNALRANASNPGLRGWRWRIAVPLTLVLGVYGVWPPSIDGDTVIHHERSFFGVLKVIERRSGEEVRHDLESGTTVHGVEYITAQKKPDPTTYYGNAAGIAAVFAQRPPGIGANVGVIGLGAGTLSAYGRKGDTFRYYEIDPSVVRIARDSGHFSYIRKSFADVEIVIGDARLEIMKEQQKGESEKFDVLVLDAFTSDAIPVHLLTLEAFRLYADVLAPDGVLAAHLSNRYFKLFRVVARLGSEVGLTPMIMSTEDAPKFLSAKADWIMLSANPRRLQEIAQMQRFRMKQMGLPPSHANLLFPPKRAFEKTPVWTDDYSDLLSAVR